MNAFFPIGGRVARRFISLPGGFPIMCFFKAPKIPPLPKPPRENAADVQAAKDRERRRAGAAYGPQATILTSGGGVTSPATTAAKTLLGQ
jgi:hypothetical protein